jgi:hypothetical protein
MRRDSAAKQQQLLLQDLNGGMPDAARLSQQQLQQQADDDALFVFNPKLRRMESAYMVLHGKEPTVTNYVRVSHVGRILLCCGVALRIPSTTRCHTRCVLPWRSPACLRLRRRHAQLTVHD